MIYAVGDVHGQYQRLVNLIGKLPLEAADQIVFVGDYIDRGAGSRQVIQFLLDLQAARGNCVFLRGNHEQMMLDARSAFLARSREAGNLYSLWMSNGGAETLDSYDFQRNWIERIPAEHWHFVESTILEYWQGFFVFVHAGFLPPNVRWLYAEDPRLWVREEFLNSTFDFGARVVFGHTPQRSGRPLQMANKLGIDTGAAYGGPLSAVGLDRENPQTFQLYQA